MRSAAINSFLSRFFIATFVLCLVLLAGYRAITLQFAISSVEFDGYELTMFVDDFSVPSWVEWIRRIALILLMFYSIFLIKFLLHKKVSGEFVALFLAVVAWRLVLTIVQILSQDWEFSFLFEQIGLLTIFFSLFMLLGYLEDLWDVVRKYYAYLAIPLSVTAVIFWITVPPSTRAEGIRDFRGFVYILSVVGFFPLMVIGFSGWRRFLAFLPLLAWGALAVATATRAMFVYLITFAAILFFLNSYKMRIAWKAFSIFAAVFSVFIAWAYIDVISEGSGAFGERISEDTRSEQFVAFFQKVEPYEFILGSPSAGHDGRFKDDLNRWGIDSGFVCILYLGGIPLLLGYICLHFSSALKLLFSRLSFPDSVVVAIALASAVQMISSEMPSLTEGYIGLLPLLGRCFFLREKYFSDR